MVQWAYFSIRREKLRCRRLARINKTFCLPFLTLNPAALPVCHAKSLSCLADLRFGRSRFCRFFIFISAALETTQNDSKRGIPINTLESTFLSMLLVLFPVDRDTHEIFCRLQSNVFVFNQSRGTLMHHVRTDGRCLSFEDTIWKSMTIYHWQWSHDFRAWDQARVDLRDAGSK